MSCTVKALWIIVLCIAPVADAAGPANPEYGIELARQQRWDEARRVLEEGMRRAPRDKRYAIELAGIHFRQGDSERAKALLQRALNLDPQDAYANDFLATLYYLEGNLPAALKYWNRIDRPQIGEVRVESETRMDPVALDEAFAFSQAETLELEELLATEARLDSLRVFQRYRFDLVPRQNEESFDLVFRPLFRRSSGSTAVRFGKILFQALATETASVELHHLNAPVMTWTSKASWDSDQQRLYDSVLYPLRGYPGASLQVFGDIRKEEWLIRGIGMRLRKWKAGLRFDQDANGRWGWNAGMAVSRRTQENDQASAENAWLISAGAGLNRLLVYVPESRFSVRASAWTEVARVRGDRSNLFVRSNGSLDAEWFPMSRGDDYRTEVRFQAGRILGAAPVDEKFVLGVEADSQLLLRAHNGLGKEKGQNPLGDGFVLINCEMDKVILSRPWLQLRLSPFVDAGRVFQTGLYDGSEGWLLDAGLQARFRVLGVAGFTLTYGKDLRTRHNTVYIQFAL